MRRIEIAGREISERQPPYMIAEIGNNHNGSVNLCKTLIERAKINGADAVKLQKRDVASLYTHELYSKPYAGQNSFGKTYGEHRANLELSAENWTEIVRYARELGVILFSTAFDKVSVDFLESLDVPAFKIASGCLKDLELIDHTAKIHKPMVVSTGGAEWADIDRAYDCITSHGAPLCLLHCTMEYPTAPEHVNLRAITAMRYRYSCPIGYSDHTVGTWAIQAAYGFSACVFEKHFTSNRALPGPDHALSIEPHELQALVHDLERITAARGQAEKEFMACEEAGYRKMGKGIYTTRPIRAGERISVQDVCLKSPATSLDPHMISVVVGCAALRDLDSEEAITLGVFG
jgi:sialic acid synthase